MCEAGLQLSVEQPYFSPVREARTSGLRAAKRWVSREMASGDEPLNDEPTWEVRF